MIRLAIIVEGQTEYNFVNRFLKKHFAEKMDICPINLRGGNINKDNIKLRVKNLIHNFHYVTTQIDFYRFKNPHLKKSIDELEADLKESVETKLQNQFIPYLQKYEFEAILFSDRKQILSHFNNKKINIAKLKEHTYPEEINHQQPPSKLLMKNYPAYRKISDGIQIAEKIGLEKIREQCPRFNQWLDQLEALTVPN